jgi:Protein of unknown function (DUF2490)
MIRLLVLLAVAACSALHAETPFWGIYFGNHALTKRSGLWLEGQARSEGVGIAGWQTLARPGYWYAIRPWALVYGGYANVQTRTAEGQRPAFTRPEHRTWQQLILLQKAKGITFQHRFFNEQRYLSVFTPGTADQVGWRTEDRFRYRIRGVTPLSSKMQAVYMNEILLNYGRNVAVRTFDQNRLYAGLGFTLNPTTRMEIAYNYVASQNRNPRTMVHQHGVVLALFSTARIR